MNWKMFIVLLLIVFFVLFFMFYMFRKPVEGFGEFKDSQMAFANKQYTYFHDTANQGIFTNAGLDKSLLNSALSQPDLYLPKSFDRDYTSYLQEDPENAYSEDDKKFCKAAKHPRDFPPRVRHSSVGCGWYFVQDPATSSVGVLGTRDAPIFKDGLPVNGEWIYDIGIASMKEDIKRCKRVKSCALMDLEGIRGVCGFCERLGYAVPINTNGTERYPDSSDGSCGEQTLNTQAECVKPKPPVISTDEGVSCGTYGRPSSDNSIRVYNKDECDKLGGNHHAGGECLKKEGGSFSWDCRNLNAPVSIFYNDDDICATNSSGRISRECLMSLASGIGFGKSGAIMRLLNSTNSPNELDQQAITVLNGVGISVPNAVLGGGDIDTHSAGTIYNQIYNAMSSGQAESVKQAARYLAIGGIDFDPCSAGSTSTACFQQEFRKAGCQPAGSAYPNDSAAGQYGSLENAAKAFHALASDMKSTDTAKQDLAMKSCLGISYSREPVKDSSGYMGCYKDSENRMIPNYQGDGKNVESCSDIARRNNHNVVGVQYGGQCFTGYNSNFKALGKETNEGNCGPLGGTWSNQVYKLD